MEKRGIYEPEQEMFSLGIKYFKGYEMPLFVRKKVVSEKETHSNLYKLIITLKNRVSLKINQKTYTFKIQTVIFLSDKDSFEDIDGEAAIIFFSPTMVNKEFTLKALDNEDVRLRDQDEYSYLFHFRRREGGHPVFLELNRHYMNAIKNDTYKLEKQLKLQPDNYWPCRSKSILIEILFHLHHPCNYPEVDMPNYEGDIIDKVLFYIQNHIAEPISIETLSKEFSINRTTLTQKFNKHIGISPIKYISNQRIELSKLILTNTTIPVTEVCFKVGINSPAYFSKIFRETIGLSPSEYRAKYT